MEFCFHRKMKKTLSKRYYCFHRKMKKTLSKRYYCDYIFRVSCYRTSSKLVFMFFK